MVKSVEEINIDLGAGYLTVSGVLSKSQDPANCVPFGSCYVSTNADYYYYYYRDISFATTGSSGTTVVSRNSAAGTSLYTTTYVVEFDPAEVRVQSGTFTITNPATSTTVSGFTGVDTTKTALIFYYKSSSSSRNNGAHAVRGVLTNSGTLTFDVGIAGSTINGHWYLMEDLGGHFTVEQISTTLGTYTSYELTNLVKYHQTLNISSFKYDNGDANPTHGHLGVFDTNEFYYFYSKYQSYTTNTLYANTFIMRFNANNEKIFMSNRGSGYFGTSATTVYHYYQDPVTSGFGMVMPNFPATSTSYTNNQTEQAIYSMSYRAKLNPDNSTVTVTRAGTNSVWTYGNHQIFDWSENERPTPTPQTKLPALSEINSMVRSIEHFSCTFSGADYYFGCHKYLTTTKGQLMENCVPFMTYRSTGGGGYCSNVMMGVKTIKPDRLDLYRCGTTGIIDCEIDLVEFEPDQVRVQRGRFSTSSGTADATISGVDLTKAAVRAYNTTRDGTQGGTSIYGWGKVKFTSSSGIQFQRGTSDNNMLGDYYVFEALGDQFSVVTYDTSGGAPSAYLTNPVELNRSFLLTSYYMGGTDTNINHVFIANYVFPNIGYMYGLKYSTSYTSYLTTYIITLKQNPLHPYNVLTQHYHDSLSTSDLGHGIYLRQPVNSGTAIVVNAVPYAAGYSSDGSASYAENAFVSHKLGSLDRVDIQRSVTYNSSVRNAVQVVDFVGYQTPYSAHAPYGTNDLVISSEHFNVTITGSANLSMDYMGAITLTKGQNPNYCVPFLTYRLDSSSTASNMAYRSALLLDNGAFTFNKAASGKQYGSVDILEFNPNRIRIQKGTSLLANASTTLNVTISGIDTTRSFLVFNYYTNSSADHQGYNHAVKGRFSSSTNIEFSRIGSTGLQQIGWWVVESLDGAFTVDHVTVSPSWSGYYPKAYSSLNVARTFMLYSFTFNNTDDNLTHWGSRGFLYGGGTELRAYLERAGNSYTFSAAVQIITFRASENVKIQHGALYMAASADLTRVDTLTDAVTGNYAVLNPNIAYMPYLSHNDGNHILSDFCSFTLVSGINVVAARRSTSYATYNSYAVLEFPCHPYYFSGYVTEQGSPASRNVYAYRRDTGALMASGTSYSGTGYFYLETAYSGSHYVICTDDESGMTYNLIGYDYVIPATISG